jgi:hypothetical protein
MAENVEGIVKPEVFCRLLSLALLVFSHVFILTFTLLLGTIVRVLNGPHSL